MKAGIRYANIHGIDERADGFGAGFCALAQKSLLEANPRNIKGIELKFYSELRFTFISDYDLDVASRYVFCHNRTQHDLALSSAASGLMACACLVVVYKWIQKNCTCFRKADIRKIPGVGACFLRSGIDKYEKFNAIIQVHSVKDLPKTGGVLTSPKLYVTIQARYEYVKTRISSSGKWEQVVPMTIPQGTDFMYITVWDQKSLGSDVEIGSVEFEVEKTLRDNPSFYGKKKPFKLTKDDAPGAFGQITLTFREGSDKAGNQEPFIRNLDPDEKPALFGALLDIVSEMDENKVPRNLEGVEKLELLAKVLQGKLTSSKSKDPVFCAVVELFPPSNDSDSSDVESDMTALAEKAKKKGLSYIPKKWFWATYGSKKDYQKAPDKPESVVPILSISSVHIDPQSPGDLFIRYFSKDGKKTKVELKYKCTDTDVEAWADALEMFREECRELKTKQAKREEEWGQLSVDDKFKEWMEFYKGQGYSDDELKQYYEQYTLAQMPEEQRKAYLDQKSKKAYYTASNPAPSTSSTSQSQ